MKKKNKMHLYVFFTTQRAFFAFSEVQRRKVSSKEKKESRGQKPPRRKFRECIIY